jgi:peptide-methionine (S)-S-oxide reductase
MRMLSFLILTLQFSFAGTALAAPAAPAETQTVVLAGGCFWGVEGVFERMRGVRRVVSGYAGGESSTATYKKVGTGRTGHAESVQITFDPKEVTYADILRVFFSVAHDPTQLNRQGPDTGPQYRSAIFYSSDAQRELAKSYIAELDKSGKFRGDIVTRVDPLEKFYPAEDYHQDYIAKNPRSPYVVMHDLPKIRNFKRLYPEYYREP